MHSRDLNPEETGRAIMRLQPEQSSDFAFPQLIPSNGRLSCCTAPRFGLAFCAIYIRHGTARLIFYICQFTR
jgi:hypothetical protein